MRVKALSFAILLSRLQYYCSTQPIEFRKTMLTHHILLNQNNINLSSDAFIANSSDNILTREAYLTLEATLNTRVV